MAQNQITSLITTSSAVFGGVGKALTDHLVLININMQSLIEVTLYAAISAIVGYGVKKGIDCVVKFFKH